MKSKTYQSDPPGWDPSHHRVLRNQGLKPEQDADFQKVLGKELVWDPGVQ